MGALTAELHVDEDQAMSVRNFTHSSHHPFVMLNLGDETLCLYLSSVEQVDRLADLVTEARTLLVSTLGEAPAPLLPEPVGDTGLTLHPLPVGVA